MGTHETLSSAEIRARLDHPVIDSDGHLIEVMPHYFDYLKDVAGQGLADRFTPARLAWHPSSDWDSLSRKERAEKRKARYAWWPNPMKNTLDRATASLPKLLYSRLDEFGIDFAVVYPTIALGFHHLPDDEMRRASCRAYNRYVADGFREYADRLTPAAVIPMHTPEEAIDELDYAVDALGLKTILMPSYAIRPTADGKNYWYDQFCLDSAHDYDTVWSKCLELKVVPTFHSAAQGLGTRTSISNFVYNHIGHFGASSEAICKAAFLGGVTRRFPELRMGFLEGGAAWACSLYSDLIGHWKKRNTNALENVNPANLDQQSFMKLFKQYGSDAALAKMADATNREVAMYGEKGLFYSGPVDPTEVDEFVHCEIATVEDVRDLFVPNFYFGCEADDPLNSWAFDTRKNPLGSRLNVIFGSDVGHWDVADMCDVCVESYELVEDGLITEQDYRDFVCMNAYRMLTQSNPDFFKGTVIEGDESRLKSV